MVICTSIQAQPLVFQDGFEEPILVPALVINEIDYDQPGADTTEFVELYNPGNAAFNLSGVSLVLINGANDEEYDSFALTGLSLAPGEYYVICDNGATVPNCNQQLPVAGSWLQNGPPDAVALEDSNGIIDTVSYEGSVAAPYTEDTGTSATDSNTIESIGLSRFPNGSDTDNNNNDFSVRCITPGMANASTISLCNATTPSEGDLVITEIMSNPAQAADNLGEWFELLNVSAQPVNLSGCTIDDASATSTHTISGDLILAPGSLALFALSGDSAQNGGLPAVDHVYTGNPLNNTGDSLTIKCNSVLIDTVVFGTTIAGAALQLSASLQTATANDTLGNWCSATTAYGLGDLGTPGAANLECP